MFAGQLGSRLATALTDDEKRLLDQRIAASLGLHDELDRNIVQRQLNDQERRLRAKNEMEQSGFATKVNVFMRGLLNTKQEVDLFLEHKLESLQAIILQTNPDLLDTTKRSVTPAFVRALRPVAGAVHHLAHAYFSPLVGDRRLERLASLHVGTHIPGVKSKLLDFIGHGEMKTIFLRSETKGDIISETERRLEEYLDTLPDETFESLTRNLLPLYYYKNLCLFDFSSVYQLFGADPQGGGASVSCAYFEAATVLERLFYVLYPFIKSPTASFEVDPQVLRLLIFVTSAHPPLESREVPDEAVRGLAADLAGLIGAVREFLAAVPLAALIRFLRNDPYYKILIYYPRLKLKAFFVAQVRLRVLGEIDKTFHGVRLSIIDEMIAGLFPGEGPKDFDFYRGSVPAVVSRLGLPVFAHVRSLSILNQFLIVHYYGYIQDLINTLNRVIPIRQREQVNLMLMHAAGLEDLRDSLRKLDYSFSPDSDEGKGFLRMRYALEKDSSQQKNYRVYVVQKDKECRGILTKAQEHLPGLVKVFEAILADKKLTYSEGTVSIRGSRVESRNTKVAMARAIQSMSLATRIVRQLELIESGS